MNPNKKENYLKISNYYFELDEEKSNFIINITREGNSCNIECNFKDGKYEDTIVSPRIEILNIKLDNNYETNKVILKVNNADESFKREDKFYLFEHEPFNDYEIKILGNINNKIHLIITGSAITDGYSKPYKIEPIYLDVWLNIKESQKEEKNNKPKNKMNIVNYLYYIVFVIMLIIVFAMLYLKLTR